MIAIDRMVVEPNMTQNLNVVEAVAPPGVGVTSRLGRTRLALLLMMTSTVPVIATAPPPIIMPIATLPLSRALSRSSARNGTSERSELQPLEQYVAKPR